MEEELKKYLLEQCRDFWLPQESKAMARISYGKYNPGFFETEPTNPSMKLHRETIFGIEDKKVNALVDLGEKQLEIAIAERILKEHPEVINLCRSCRKLARTPRAKQCRHCGHDWH